QQLGFGRILTLDMGGTSTDTARYNGQYDYQSITQIEQVEMSSPALAIETVAAGGGSICSFQQGRLQVGPASAGAQPGPACYDAGGPLTITDVNLLLSKLDPSGLGIPVRVEAAQAALQQVQLLLSQKTGTSYTDTELLQGFEQIANEKMAEAIRRISVAKGFDPKEYALLVFGGAGGLHACKIAELLGIDSILLPYDAGILSAYGMGQARIERFAERQILQLLHEIAPYIEHIIEKLHQQAMHELQKENLAKAEIERTAVQLFVRFKGQESTLEITFTEVEQIAAQFQAQYTQLFGHYPSKQQLELERIRVVLASKAPKNSPIPHSATTHYPKPHSTLSRAVDQQAIAIFDWDELTAGATIKGPAILRNAHATCYIEPNWAFEVRGKAKHMIGKWSRNVADQGRNQKEAIELELFTNRFGAIALEMGAQLQRTAFSVNIKERLDFSCAILDAQAELLVNAPHIPVHLGSLGICARLVLEHSPLQPGDVLLTNHPKYGGSHLPDLTMLCGVFTQNGECIGYVINRAHHAEIGGKRPGSMPPDATSLEEEGVSFTPTYLVKAGVVQWEAIRRMLAEAAFPSRMIEENIADLNAALASLRNGAHALQQLVAEHSLEKVQHYMQALKRSAQLALEQALPNYLNRQFEAIEYLDDGHRLQVQISVSEQELLFDFTGTSSRHPYNLNANISIVYSAILYVLRLLCKRAIPLNEGLMQKVRVQLPENSFLHPTFVDDAAACPAVVGGNTEVSQRLVDTLLKAFGLAACSQGTMNNFLFGNTDFGYYETIGGGVGAGPGFEGHSAVHQHMTNTRITDPEDLEFRYPVRLHRFGIRRDSGGEGQFRGGDGIVREVEFLEPMEMTMISQHRKEQPYGLAGGSPGKVGRQTLIRKNGTIEFLKGIDSQTLGAGDRVVIETPGGGGYGKKEEHGKNNT
ncbi:MAG: hydantoinase B/oxoprolinase family protein, partial [Bacteroidota bacterium]